MGRTACTEPRCLYKGDLYLYFIAALVIGPEMDTKSEGSFEEAFGVESKKKNSEKCGTKLKN